MTNDNKQQKLSDSTDTAIAYSTCYPQYGLLTNKLDAMKKILLTPLYPFWFFFSATWIGNVMMIPIVLSPIPILLSIIFPDLMNTTGEEAEGIGTGVGILTLLCSPFTAVLFMRIGYYLEHNYEKWNYKTEMDTKMI